MSTTPPRSRPVKVNIAATPPPADDPYAPVEVDFHDATPEQVARALCAAAKPPDPSKRRLPRR